MRYAWRHWRGELDLAQSYWINVVWLSFATLVLVGLVNRYGLLDELGNGADLNRVLLAVGGVIGGLLLLNVWQVVGCWRAAQRTRSFNRVSGRSQAGPLAVQALLVVGVVASLPSLFQLGRAAYDLGLIALERDMVAEFRVEVADNELQLYGFINYGSATELLNYMKYNPQLSLIYLESSGGRIGPAMAVGNEVRSRGLRVYVERECSSACTLVYLGGTERILHHRAKLGFHRSKPLSGLEDSASSADDAQRDFLVSQGASARFADQAMKVSPDEMWYPSLDELVEAGVVTHIYDGSRLMTAEDWRSRDWGAKPK